MFSALSGFCECGRHAHLQTDIHAFKLILQNIVILRENCTKEKWLLQIWQCMLTVFLCNFLGLDKREWLCFFSLSWFSCSFIVLPSPQPNRLFSTTKKTWETHDGFWSNKLVIFFASLISLSLSRSNYVKFDRRETRGPKHFLFYEVSLFLILV